MKLRRAPILLLALLLSFGLLETSHFGQVQASVSSDTILSVEAVPSPPYPFMLLPINNGAQLLVSTNRSTVYTYNGASFTKIFDISRVGNTDVYGLFQDEQGNIYVSPKLNGTIWKSPDNGQTWTRSFNMVSHGGKAGRTAPKPNWYSFGNGTILTGQWTDMGPYLYRSDNWGSTWLLWRNFTAIFPQYAIEDPLNKPAYWIRHIHAVFYVQTENALFVSLGDLMHTLYKSTDGGNTWTLTYPHGFTSYIILGNRVLLGADGDEALTLYESQNFKPVWTPKGKNASYSSVNVFRSFAYDETYDVLYVGVGTYPAAANRAHYTAILASTDKGETWTPILTLDTQPTSNKEAPDLALYGEYIYYSWSGTLKRFSRLSQAEVSYIHNQDSLTKTVADRTLMSASTRVLKNPQLTIHNTSLTNLLTNPSFETWGTPPMGWTTPWASWTGSRIYTNGTGYHGSNSYKLILSGYGTTVVSTSPALSLTKGFYTLSAYVKTNASYPRAFAYIMTNEYYVSTSGYRLTEYLVGNWRKIQGQFYLEADKMQTIWLRVDVPSGYTINATVEWDAIALYKHPSYLGSNAPYFTENFNVPFTPTSISTTDGNLTVGNQTISFARAELPKTVLLGNYWVGNTPIQLLSGNIVNLTISGDTILEVGNATLERKGTGLVYIGKMHSGFNVINNAENALAVFHSRLFDVATADLNSKVLSITVNATAGANSTTYVYTGNQGKPQRVSVKNGTVSWSYNNSSSILTINVTHSGPAKIWVDWRQPGDVNGDGIVDNLDLTELKASYGSTPASTNWNQRCDFNADDIINASDLQMLGKNYGKIG